MVKYLIFKRVFDVLVSALIIFCLLPVFFIVSLLIYLKMGSPVIYSQYRPGKNCRPFLMYKFRTMSESDNKQMLNDADRITKLGGFLRSTSLDELPELLNVIKGDMSLVGPRPLLMEYISRYSEFQMRRHEVLPGISGLAQVKGRNNLSWYSKFRYDVLYVDRIGLKMDIAILLLTIKVVILRSGFRSHGESKKFGN